MKLMMLVLLLLVASAHIGQSEDKIELKRKDGNSVLQSKPYRREVSPLDRDKILDHVRQLKTKILALPLDKDNCENGLYTGVAGVGYALWYLSLNTEFADEKDQLLQEALKRVIFNLANVNLKHYNDSLAAIKCKEASFAMGDAGMFGVGALICHQMNDTTQTNGYLAKFLETTLELEGYLDTTKQNADEILFGRTGVLFGMLLLNDVLAAYEDEGETEGPISFMRFQSLYGQHLGENCVPDSAVSKLLSTTIQSQRYFAQKSNSPIPFTNSIFGMEFTGAGHGLAANLQLFLSFPQLLDSLDEKAIWDVKTCVDFIVSLQTPDGNFPYFCRKPAFFRKILAAAYFMVMGKMVHWCHGATGVIFLLATAYKKWGEQKHLAACEKAADCVWNKGLLKKGAGICHGISGSAYAFLIMYRLTKNDKYLYRAHRFAEFMLSEEFNRGAEVPSDPLSLFGGLAGAMCFYLDLLNPEEAQFPIFPVTF